MPQIFKLCYRLLPKQALIATFIPFFLLASVTRAQTSKILLYSITEGRQPGDFDGGYTLDGSRMSTTAREKLLSEDNFGIGGTYPKLVNIVDQFSESGSLTSVTNLPYDNIFFFGSFNKNTLERISKSFTQAEIDSLHSWSVNGGKVIIANSGYYRSGDTEYDSRILAEKWGIRYELQVPSPLIRTDEGANSTIFDGPFGSLIGANQGGSLQSYFSIVPDKAIVLATDFESKPTLILDCNTLDLIIADIDAYTNVGSGVAFDQVTTGPLIQNAQDIFWTNTIVFMDQLQRFPEIVLYSGSLLLAERYNNYQWYRDDILISTDSIIANPEVGRYFVEVTTNGGCLIASDPFDIKCAPTPILDLGADILLCRNNELTLEATNLDASYLWQDQSEDSTFNVTQSGTYWVKVTNQCATVIDSIDVLFTQVLNLGKDTTLCSRETLILDPGITNTKYLWSNGTDENSLEAKFSGLYWVEISDSCGVYRDSINVKFDNQIFLNLGADTTMCPNTEILLNASSDNAFYEWQDESNEPTYQVTAPGRYTVTATNSCSSEIDRIDIRYFEEFDLGADQEICEGSQLLLNATMTDASYIWQDGTTASTYTVRESGEYSVKISHPYCESQSDDIIISVKPSPSLDISSQRISCLQDSYVIDVTIPNATYLWEDGSTDPIYTVTENGFYLVTITVDGCSTTEGVNISRKSCPGILDLPNVFTPNNDGYNDTFVPRVRRNIDSMNTKIFDRTGNLIYETSSLLIEWNGQNSNGHKVPAGTYYYYISFIDLAQDQLEVKGILSVLY